MLSLSLSLSLSCVALSLWSHVSLSFSLVHLSVHVSLPRRLSPLQCPLVPSRLSLASPRASPSTLASRLVVPTRLLGSTSSCRLGSGSRTPSHQSQFAVSVRSSPSPTSRLAEGFLHERRAAPLHHRPPRHPRHYRLRESRFSFAVCPTTTLWRIDENRVLVAHHLGPLALSPLSRPSIAISFASSPLPRAPSRLARRPIPRPTPLPHPARSLDRSPTRLSNGLWNPTSGPLVPSIELALPAEPPDPPVPSYASRLPHVP